MNRLGKYLTPSKSKLQSKGVKSVESRVVNLNEFCPELTIDRMRQNMVLAAEEVYGLKSQELPKIECDEGEKLAKLYGSWDYIYGITIPCDFVCDGRFDWGGIQLKVVVKKGVIEAIQVFSDSMDFNISETMQNALKDKKFEKQILVDTLFNTLDRKIAEDISSLISSEIF